MQLYKEVLSDFGIEFSQAVPFSACSVINERKLNVIKKEFTPQSAIIFIVPYYVSDGERNISKYAVSEDYHLFMRGLFEKVCPLLSEKYNAHFCGMADSSPVNEVKAAAYAGLGMLGDNGMIINGKYGCYVFIGALYTDAVLEYLPDQTKMCLHCGKCREACPMKNGRQCLSAVTQKKGELTPDEIQYIKEYGSVWGCDICADVCPFSQKAVNAKITTPIEFFCKNRTPHITSDMINSMPDEDFICRAYSWRGKAVVLRNLKLFE